MKEDQQILEDALFEVSKDEAAIVPEEIPESDHFQGLDNRAALEVEEGPDPLENDDIGEFANLETMEELIKDEASEKDNCVDEDPLQKLDPLAQENRGKNT